MKRLRVLPDLAGGRFIQCYIFGRVIRLFHKPMGWPYYYRRWGVRAAGIGSVGCMLFDRRGSMKGAA